MYLVEAWKTRFPGYRSVNVSDLSLTMIKTFLDNSNNEDYLSKVCADPQILCLALFSQDEELAYKILEYTPPVDAKVYEISEISGMSSLEVACQFGCNRQILEILLGRSNVDRGAAGLKSGLLVLTCKRGSKRKKTVIDLLDLGFDPSDRTVEGVSALMLASSAGDLELVEILIHHGADVFAIDHDGWSAIHFALLSNCEELWHLLRSVVTNWNAVVKVDLSEIRSRDVTALHLAAGRNSFALGFLLDNDLICDINHVTDQQETALYVAVLYGIPRNVDLLLEAHADTTLSSSDGYLPLHLAAYHGAMEIVKIFARRGANLLLQDNSGFTPELIARKRGYLDVANFLKEQTSIGDGDEPILEYRTLNY